MVIAIIGSRTFTDYALLKAEVDKVAADNPISLIVSGGAIGADTLGARYAVEHCIDKLVFKPDWNRFGKGAGFIRNKDIVDNAEVVIAFWNGVSKGTKHSIDYATKQGKKVIVIIVVEENE